MAKNPSMGRKKIKIAKIEMKNHLQVTFSKRRSGLFKKASELCTLCGVEFAIIVFSPAKKVYSFGHPNVESIIDRFLSRNPHPIISNRLQFVEGQRHVNVLNLNLKLTQILVELEVEKKKGETLNQMRKTRQKQCWWEAPICELALHELEQLKDSMEELNKNVTTHQNSIYSSLIANGVGIFDNYDIKPVRCFKLHS
ncbi:agamous-like mads-box protein agl62 [Nicotiana attenuata]|uniref:Agamous-like mads-box protein agl62 n=1 Tax=Nicotiana attenuata TaxID=49451 RepID=A0A1J6JQC5_NICAT|nr:agamous-like mads-box protein agl62 [Nicotiana attenuata]